MEIYLFSILDQIHWFFIWGGLIGIIICLIIGLDDFNDKNTSIKSIFIKHINICILLIIIIVLGNFIPSQNSLIKSYICIKGKDQLTNKNIERVIKAIDLKTDNIIKEFKR